MIARLVSHPRTLALLDRVLPPRRHHAGFTIGDPVVAHIPSGGMVSGRIVRFTMLDGVVLASVHAERWRFLLTVPTSYLTAVES